jgi:hypothetical protein
MGWVAFHGNTSPSQSNSLTKIEAVGHSRSHSPQPRQADGSDTSAIWSIRLFVAALITRTFRGQKTVHSRHPSHRSFNTVTL